jgi:hypothetical protein
MIRALALMLLAALPAASAVIRGNVVENMSGKLLARALVVLEPMPGTPGEVRTIRTSRLGGFEFEYLAAGVYVLTASRRGFLPGEYGQKRWNSAGQPIVLEAAATAFLTIRLLRGSAVAGTIVDENDIGLPGHQVAVYRASQPPEYVRSATADDRGMYRIGGLDPGKYFVRTAGGQYEDGAYLPTYSRETVRAEQAQMIEASPEQQTERIDIRPFPGKLFTLTVGMEPPEEATFTLASAIGRTTVKATGHRFTALAPGDYELYAEAPGKYAYQRLSLTRDSAATLMWSPPARLIVTGGPTESAAIRIRRRDLAGSGPESVVPVEQATVPAGRWELMLVPPDGYYASGGGWIEVVGRQYGSYRFQMSSGAGSIRGTVKDAPYAPVFLEGYDPALLKQVGDLRAARADARGQFRFTSLAPGTYRLLSTFEYRAPDTEAIDSATPLTVVLERNSDLTKDIDLWVIR